LKGQLLLAYSLPLEALFGQLLNHILYCKLEMAFVFRHSADMDTN
jgi:hypothetical protein